jgi:DNA-binding SARP family transcriptional activator
MPMSLSSPSAPVTESPTTSPPSSPSFLLRTFGALELRAADAPDSPLLLQRGKPLALLAYCATERRRTHSRDALSALLWADAAPERSRHNVRQALWRLRRVLGDTLEMRDDAIVGVRAEVLLDHDQFTEAVAQGDVPAALAAYTGPFLSDVAFPGGDEFEDWARSERMRLEETLVRLIETEIRADPPRLRPAERRRAVDALIERAPDSLEAQRVALDLAFELGDRVGATREADRLEALTIRSGMALSAAMQSSVDRAREYEAPPEEPGAPFPMLELVGRDEPFSAAMIAWAQARRGESRFLLIRGVAGVGKSRLLGAIADRCVGRRTQVLVARANPGEQDVPYGFAAMLARELSELRGAAGISPDSARELVALDPALGSRFNAAPPPGERGETDRRRSLALVDLIQAVAEQQPLALFLDDLHWADSASSQMLAMVLARVRNLPLLVVGTLRALDGPGIMPSPHQLVDLEPLSAATLRASLESSGSWPAEPAAADFLATVSASCRGLPLELSERLSLAIGSGLLAYRHSHWSSPDWRRATEIVAASAPLERLLKSCTADEHALLLCLAVAGIPLSPDVVQQLTTSDEWVRTLEAKGFVCLDQTGWRPAHDTVAETLLAESPGEALVSTHARLARAFEATGRSERWASALRHHLAAGDAQAASTRFAALLARARSNGDRRPALVLLRDLLGDDLPSASQDLLLRSVPWYQRTPELITRIGMLMLATISVLAVGAAWYTWQRPILRMVQTALVTQHAPLFGPGALRLVPSVLLRLGPGDTVDLGRRTVRVRSLDPGTRFLTGDSVIVDNGIANFGGLRFTTTNSKVRLRFESPGYRSTDLEVRTITDTAPTDLTVRVLSGRFRVGTAWQLLDNPALPLHATSGSLIDGIVQLRYSSSLPAASVWLSMTPTWGTPESAGRELLPITTPVSWEVIDVPVTLQAPATPGHYWLLFAVAAEQSGGYALSGTNWTMNKPIWGDGNDLAQLPDSVVHAANRTGTVSFMSAYPMRTRRNRPECRSGSPDVIYCPAKYGLAGIPIEVR